MKISSYYLREPQQENSSVFHNHIDACDRSCLESIIQEIEMDSPHFQNKIYPVAYLHLGPQTQDPAFSTIYPRLPNFHPIKMAENEAFSTGKMGVEGFNYDQVKKTLKIAFSLIGKGVMTELEEDIYSEEFDENGISIGVNNRGNTSYTVDWTQLSEWATKKIQQIPRFELHHGFDIKKLENEKAPPIYPEHLCNETTDAGFNVGGWFIFHKKNIWSFRSNEFSNQEHAECLEILKNQSAQLKSIVTKILPGRDFTSSCSLEKVHAMWSVE